MQKKTIKPYTRKKKRVMFSIDASDDTFLQMVADKTGTNKSMILSLMIKSLQEVSISFSFAKTVSGKSIQRIVLTE